MQISICWMTGGNKLVQAINISQAIIKNLVITITVFEHLISSTLCRYDTCVQACLIFFFFNHKFSGNIPFLRIPNINAYNKQTFSPMKTTMPTASLELHICEHRGQYNIYLCPWDEVVKDGHNKIPITSLASSQLNKRAEMSLLKIKCFDSCGKPTQNLKGWLPLPMGPWDIVHHHDSQKRYAI